MKIIFNRFAIIPFHCTDCHRYVWLEKYRKAEVSTDFIYPPYVKVKICNECIKHYNIKGKEE